MDEIIIKNARSEHIPLISLIEKEAASVFPPGLMPAAERAKTVPLEILQEGVSKGLLRVALNMHYQVLGHSLVRHFEDIAILAKVDVRPPFMRKGIGGRLVNDAIDNLRGYPCIWLTTFDNLPWGETFYKRFGFKSIPVEQQPETIKQIMEEENFRGFSNRVAMCFCPEKNTLEKSEETPSE